jgi:Protein of unknown function (DUF4058)
MQSPFPGMDPYLEHPALWPDVHNRLMAALADDLSERVAPRLAATSTLVLEVDVPMPDEVKVNSVPS